MKKFKKEDVQEGMNNVFKAFFQSVVAMATFDKTQKELTYVKSVVTVPNGGSYLISVLHLEGEKLDLTLLRQVADSQVPTPEKDETGA